MEPKHIHNRDGMRLLFKKTLATSGIVTAGVFFAAVCTFWGYKEITDDNNARHNAQIHMKAAQFDLSVKREQFPDQIRKIDSDLENCLAEAEDKPRFESSNCLSTARTARTLAYREVQTAEDVERGAAQELNRQSGAAAGWFVGAMVLFMDTFISLITVAAAIAVREHLSATAQSKPKTESNILRIVGGRDNNDSA